MRRPLFLASLCLVILAALWLVWSGSGKQQGSLGASALLQEGDMLTVTGQVYRKENRTIYLKDIDIQTFQKNQASAANLRQEIPQNVTTDNLITESAVPENAITGNLICKLQEETQLQLGNIVAVSGTFQPFLRGTNPGEFDQRAYYATLGITGKIEEGRILGKSKSFWWVREGLHGLKYYWRERLYRIFPEKEASVMTAMLLGDKSGLDSEIKELYQRNGIIHILSISGLHITMIGMGIYRILKRAGVPVWLAAFLGGGVLLLYGIMIGLGVSACRAIGMYLIRMLGELWGRSYDMLTAMGVVGAATILGNPLYLHHAGFLLSYGAVFGIGIFSPLLLPEKRKKTFLKYEENRWKAAVCRQGARLWEGLKESLCVSLAITAVTMPVLLWFYYEVPVYSVFLNLLILPLMKPVMAAGMLAMLVPGLEWAGKLDCIILRGYELFCRLFDKLPFHTWNPGQPQMWQIAAYYLLLGTAAVLPQVIKKLPGAGRASLLPGQGTGEEKCFRWQVVRGFCLCAALLILGLHALPEDKVTFLDVGQGDGICISTGAGENYLFDCGSSSRSSVGKYVLIPFLKQQGISHLDAVFVSHPDKDHISGIIELLEEGGERGVTVGALVLADIAEETKREAFAELYEAVGQAEERLSQREGTASVKVQYIKAGDSFGKKGFRAICLHPPKGYDGADANAYSQCFYVEMKGGLSLLLTGDVEGEGEQALIQQLQKRNIRKADVLKAAHHGSRNSTGTALLHTIRPRIAVISCGKGNSYGHPHREVTERLEQAEVPFLQTAETGAVTVTLGKKGILAEGYVK